MGGWELVGRGSPPVEWESDGFSVRTSVGVVAVTMTEHHATVESARLVVEPFLRAWETDAFLTRGRPVMTFEFLAPEVVDRQPTPGVRELHPMVARGTAVVSVPTLHIVHGRLPEPPSTFVFSDDVAVMALRWRNYLEEREPLQAMAYGCLTRIESRFGGTAGKRRKNAATALNVEPAVLDKLGELTSMTGDDETARKFNHPGLRPPQGAESTWITQVIPALIRRVGEVAVTRASSLATVAMSNFVAV